MRPHILRTATAARALDDGNFKQPASINPLSITARMTSLSTHDCLLATAAAAAACRVERDCPRVVIVSTARVRFDSIVIFRRYSRNVLSSSLQADVVPPNRAAVSSIISAKSPHAHARSLYNVICEFVGSSLLSLQTMSKRRAHPPNTTPIPTTSVGYLTVTKTISKMIEITKTK